MLDEKIVNLFKKQLDQSVLKITDCSNGIEQTVKIVQTDKNKYIVKSPHRGKEIMIYRENFVCARLKNKLIPKIIFKNQKFIIESFIEGKSVSEAKLSQKNSFNIYFELGKIISKLHKIKMSGFGELQKNAKGQHKTATGHINFLFRQNIPLLLKDKSFDKNFLEHLKNFTYQNIDFFEKDESVLLHFDLHGDNFLVDNNKLSGIIDFGDASCGPIEYDLAKLYIETSSKYFSNFIEGYGRNKLDFKKVEYFTILHLLYMLPYYSSKNKKKYTKILKLLKKITKY